ncbi:MAG: hypothetical protein K5920_02620 [Bacteroidales bacterium]|nr:hypothetical protein [Bacteroidales bacterium]
MKTKRFFCIVLMLLLTGIAFIQAQDKCDYTFEVSYSNCGEIKIGNGKAVKGVRFDDVNEIHWAKNRENQTLKVWNCYKGCYELLVFNNKEKRTMFVSDREANTKGWLNDDDFVAFDTLYYMLDTLKIRASFTQSTETINKAIFYVDDEIIECNVSKTKDGKEYIIPRTLLGKHDKKPFYLDIVEKDVKKDWEYMVWRKLYVVPLPLEIK